jgi:hypothetical protein
MVAPLIAAGVSAAGSLLSGIDWNGDRAAQRRMIENLIRRAGEIKLPELERLRAETLGPSAQESVYSDPTLEATQYDALGQLGNIADSGGYTLEDRALNEELQREAAQKATNHRQAIQAMLARQGNGSGAISAAMQMGSAREQADRASKAGLHTASQAQKRALEAMMARAKTAGGMREQQFGEKSRRAQAHDAIDRYNAGARSNANAYNAGLSQQNFQNSMTRLGMQAGPAQNAANFYGQNAANMSSNISNGFTGAGMLGQGIYNTATANAGNGGFRTDTVRDEDIDWSVPGGG